MATAAGCAGDATCGRTTGCAFAAFHLATFRFAGRHSGTSSILILAAAATHAVLVFAGADHARRRAFAALVRAAHRTVRCSIYRNHAFVRITCGVAIGDGRRVVINHNGRIAN